MEKIKAALDKAVEKVISRKFLAWLTATGLAGYGLLESSDWVTVTSWYIATQGAVDLADKIKSLRA